MNKIELIYRIPTPRSIYGMLKREIKDCHTVLDIGCGAESLLYQLGMNSVRVTGLDIWPEYALKHRNDERYVEYITQNVLSADFSEKSFDLVLMTDVLEHIDKQDAYDYRLLDKLSSWATKKVIVMLPVGFVDNDSYDGNPYLYHKSGWYPFELENAGFDTVETIRIRRKKYFGITLVEFVKTIFAVKNI